MQPDQPESGREREDTAPPVRWAGPGQWRSHAAAVQQPLTPEQEAEIEQAGQPEDGEDDA